MIYFISITGELSKRYKQNLMSTVSLQLTYSQSNRNKSKNKAMGPNETDKLLHSKGNPKENKKTTYRMGENSFQ